MKRAILFFSFISFAAATVPCGRQVLDFDSHGEKRGQYLNHNIYRNMGIESIACSSREIGPNGKCRIFDTNVPVGQWAADRGGPCNCGPKWMKFPNTCDNIAPNRCGDPDLNPPGQNLDNILIIDECTDPTDPPDDTDSGGCFIFKFAERTTIHTIAFIDTEEKARPDIKFTRWNWKETVYGPYTANNGYAEKSFQKDNIVRELQICLHGSGAIGWIDFTVNECSTTTTAATIATRETTTTTEATTPTTTTVVETTATRDTTTTTEATTPTTTTVVETTATRDTTTTTTEATPTTTTTTPNFTPATGANGDPHIHRWNNDRYTFQGECDLVLVHSGTFHDQGLDLQLRTTIKGDYSYIEAVALRLGQHVLEFRKESVLLDGVEFKNQDLPVTFGSRYTYDLTYRIEPNRQGTREKKFYMLQLGDDSSMELKFYRHFGSVSISGHPIDFGDAVGLSGTFPDGDMLGRDGRPMKKTDEYGFEWQVDPEHDPILFRDTRAPQLPFEKCRMPTVTKSIRRQLRGASKLLYKQAKKACRAQTGADLEACIDDVLAVGDLGLGEEWTVPVLD